MLQIHERIKNERIKAGLSEDEVAERVGVVRTTYQYWEKKTPGIDKIKKVATALGLPEDYFFGKTAEKPPLNKQNESGTKEGDGKNFTTDPNPYLKLLEDNDRFFKTEYHNLLVSLNKIIEIGLRSEELIKLNLEHIGNVEAHLKEVEPDVVHEQINNQIAGVEVNDQKGIYAGK